MRRVARRLAISITAAAVATVALASPAQAASNPYSAAQACATDFGGSWASVSDGHRSITAPDGTRVGDVYLMYNSGTGYNCVATIKRVAVGSSTGVSAGIRWRAVPGPTGPGTTSTTRRSSGPRWTSA
ncbi:hypothetical protein [Micromonospora zhanjiangensis]